MNLKNNISRSSKSPDFAGHKKDTVGLQTKHTKNSIDEGIIKSTTQSWDSTKSNFANWLIGLEQNWKDLKVAGLLMTKKNRF